MDFVALNAMVVRPDHCELIVATFEDDAAFAAQDRGERLGFSKKEASHPVDWIFPSLINNWFQDLNIAPDVTPTKSCLIQKEESAQKVQGDPLRLRTKVQKDDVLE